VTLIMLGLILGGLCTCTGYLVDLMWGILHHTLNVTNTSRTNFRIQLFI